MTLLYVRTKHLTRGFTLIALVVVLVMIALLAAISWPALANTRLRSIQLKCATHLRQIGVAAQMYAQSDEHGRFPDCTGAGWAWDLPNTAINGLLKNGATRETLYCPGYPELSRAWDFSFGPDTHFYRIIGYSLAFKGAGGIRSTNITESLTPSPYRINNRDFQPLPSERVLGADATLSIGSNESDRTKNRYTEINAGFASRYRAPHLNGTMPAGGNLLFLDGHIQWKPFRKMRVRTDSDPSFWW